MSSRFGTHRLGYGPADPLPRVSLPVGALGERTGARRTGRRRLDRRRDDDGRRRPPAARRRGVLRGDRAAVDGCEPGPAHARARPGARVRVGDDRRQAPRPPAVDRRRRAGRDRRRRGVGAGDLQLLAPGRAHRRRVPGCGRARPSRRHQHHRHRSLRHAQGAAAGSGWGARDRGLVPAGGRRRPAVAAYVRGAGGLPHVDGREGEHRHHRPGRADPRAPSGTSSCSRELHPGATVDAARAATGWGLRVADDLAVTAPPSATELDVLRELEATKGAVA